MSFSFEILRNMNRTDISLVKERIVMVGLKKLCDFHEFCLLKWQILTWPQHEIFTFDNDA
jgi:hypothetical protein